MPALPEIDEVGRQAAVALDGGDGGQMAQAVREGVESRGFEVTEMRLCELRDSDLRDELELADLVLVGMPRNMDGTYGPAAQKVRDFISALQKSITVPIRAWDERLTSVQANRFLLQANVRRKDRKQKVDKTAAAILLQSYLDSGAAGALK